MINFQLIYLMNNFKVNKILKIFKDMNKFMIKLKNYQNKIISNNKLKNN